MSSKLSGPLHQSGAKSLEDCPRKFKAEADGLPPNFEPFDRGSVIARIAERLRYAALDPKADLRAVAREQLEFDRPLLRSAEARADVEEIVAGMFGPDFRIDWTVAPAGAEVRLEQPWYMDEEFRAVAEDGPVAYQGTFDVEAVEPGEIRIEDDKTWSFIPKSKEIGTDIQARTYALAALARRPKAEAVTFQWNLIRHGFSLAWIFERGAPWAAEHRDWLSRRRLERDEYSKLDTWPATPGDGCDSCPIRHKCPERLELVDQGAMIPEETPTERAKKLLAIKGLVAEYEKAVRRDAAEGPIAIGDGKVLGFHAKTKREVRAGTERKVLEDLALLGLPTSELDTFFPRKFTVGGVERAFKRADSETWADWSKSALQAVKSTEFTTFRLGSETGKEPE